MKNVITLFFLFLTSFIFAQANPNTIDAERIAKEYLATQAVSWNLSSDDIQDIYLSDEVYTKHNGVTSLYYVQQYKGIPIENAIYNISLLPSGKVLIANSRFVSNIKYKINNYAINIEAAKALQISIKSFGIESNTLPEVKERKNNFFRYKKGTVSQVDITAQLQFIPNGENLTAVWSIVLQPAREDLWDLKINATTGEIIKKRSLTIHCSLGHHQETHSTSMECPKENHTQVQSFAGPDGSSYRIFPFSTESPLTGERVLVTNPAVLAASPYGWHDTNGADGAEYTITRGNNVHAYLDLDDSGMPQNDEPDGGANLVFDFPYNENAEAVDNKKAAVTNLFYIINSLHDFSFQYGFDEDAGNFQFKNYTAQAYKADDAVMAQAQDGSGTNNANFSTPLDGTSPTMQMMIFSNQGNKSLTILSPASIAGTMNTGSADFGPPVSETPINGALVLFSDSGNFGCEASDKDLTGKIALIDRGDCFFAIKAISAQDQGAIAAIIVNFENGTLGMTASSELASQVNIPVISIGSQSGNILKEQLLSGETIQVNIVQTVSTGPETIDSDFANMVIEHEFTHGISNRLTGGGATTSCLFNDEQMGEGWSDFIALALSAKTTETGAEARSLGRYVMQEGLSGSGLRRYPYSTDMTISPITYYDVLNTQAPHPLGEVWTACLWDLHWKMVDKYGFDADFMTGTGGNNKAIQLVFDGMKLQPCSPGFVDGRDAILAADVANNNGENACLIWEVFARRGLGASADQGDTEERNDGTEAYDTPKSCVKSLAIYKEVSPTINAGDVILVHLTITNYKGSNLTAVSATDIIPNNANFVSGSSSVPATVSGSVITFDLGDMADKTEKEITYKLSTATDYFSTNIWSDDFESGASNWEIESIEGTNPWNWEDSELLGNSYSGTHSFFVDGAIGASDQILRTKNSVQITGTQPILRFFHQFDTKPGEDGGILEFSTDGGSSWFDAAPYFFRVPYVRPISFWTFTAVDQNAFSGNSKKEDAGSYVESMLDLSSFVGKNLDIRFHFGTHFEEDDEESNIWSVDDIEFMDMLNYNSESCVTSSEGDQNCTTAPEKGTVIYSGTFVGTEDIKEEPFDLSVYPNPATDFINIRIQSNIQMNTDIQMTNTNGQVLLTQKINLRKGIQHIQLPIALPSGVYFLRTATPDKIHFAKVVVQ